MDENIWNEISRNQFVELDVNIRFSKIDNLISSMDKFFPFFGEIDPSILNDDSRKILYFTQFFKEINQLNGLPAELQLINGGNYKFVSYFKLDSFVTNMDSIPNETTILAKVQRK
jgi:hypothetical protein